MTFEQGATFWVPSGPDGKEHLFVLLTGLSNDNNYAWASITGIKQNKKYDETCTFQGGEHPRLGKSSYVYYRKSETISAHHLEKMCAIMYYRQVENMSEVHVQRMIDGFGVSKQTPPYVITFLAEYTPKPLPETAPEGVDSKSNDRNET